MDLTKETLQYVIGPVLVALIAAIPYIFKAVVAYKDKKRKAKDEKEFRLSVQDISKMYHIMRTLMTHVNGINRVIIIKSHNGGGVPSPKSPVFLTALHEVPLLDTHPMLEDVQNRPVDAFHSNHILTPLASTGSFHINKSTSDGFLKDIYEAYNHEWSTGATLCMDKFSMVYLVISFRTGETEERTPFEKEKIQAAINRITNLMKRHEV